MTNKNTIIKLLTETNIKLLSVCLLLLRCTAGVILFVAGSGKVFGWFGGAGMELTVKTFVTQFGIPAPLAYLSSFTELIGGFLLIVGLLTRPAAFAVMINMFVATIVTLPNGFLTAAAFPFSLLIGAVIIQLAGPMAIVLTPYSCAREKSSTNYGGGAKQYSLHNDKKLMVPLQDGTGGRVGLERTTKWRRPPALAPHHKEEG